MRRALNNFRGVQLNHCFWVTDLEFADNIVLLGEEPATVKPVLDRIICEAMPVGLEVNMQNEAVRYLTRVFTLCIYQWRDFRSGTLLQIPGL